MPTLTFSNTNKPGEGSVFLLISEIISTDCR